MSIREKLKRKYPLHYAVSRGSLKDTLDVLDKGADLQLKIVGGDTALHIAAGGCNTQIIQVLAERTTDINVKDVNGRTPLYRAVIRKTYEAVEILIENGGDVNIQDDEGNSPLHYATLHFLEVVPLLIRFGANIDLPNKEGQTALHIAAGKCYIFWTWNDKAVLTLLQLGATVNVEDNQGNTPLHAIMCNPINRRRAAICSSLLSYGAKIEKQNNLGETPLLLSIDRDLKDCAALMLSLPSVINAVEIPDHLGNLPLHVAIRRNDYSIVKSLLQLGADIESENSQGETSLQIAMNGVNRGLDDGVSICELLIMCGADVDVEDELGMTPLHYAVKAGNPKLVAKLLEYWSDVNCRDELGKTPFMYVGYSPDAELLFSTDPERIGPNDDLQRALYRLTMDDSLLGKSRTEVIHELLDWGASPQDVKDFAVKPRSLSIIGDAITEYVIKRDLVNLPKHLSMSELNIPAGMYLKDGYLESCTKEVERMKRERYENHSIFDIFRLRENPTYCNKRLTSIVATDQLRRSYPIYGSLLKSTFCYRAERDCLICEIVSIFPVPLPSEVTSHILTYLDRESLRNLFKALVSKSCMQDKNKIKYVVL